MPHGGDDILPIDGERGVQREVVRVTKDWQGENYKRKGEARIGKQGKKSKGLAETGEEASGEPCIGRIPTCVS